MKVKDVMRTDFISFQVDDKLDYIVKTFAEKNITSAPVFDGKEFKGIADSNQIVNALRPKKFIFLWKKKKQTPMEELNKIIAFTLLKKSRTYLTPEQDLSKVLGKIVNTQDFIPVFDKKNLVGIVRNEDMNKFVLKEFAKDSLQNDLKDAKKGLDSNMSTALDKMLTTINKEGKVSAKKIAKDMGISIKSVEKMGECLHRHHLAKMNYSFFKGAEFRRVNNEKR